MKKLKTTVYKIRYQADNPGGRALEAFFQKIKGKSGAESIIQTEVIDALVLNQDWTRFKGKQKRGKEFPVLVEYIRQRAMANPPDRNFFVRLGRALGEKRKEKKRKYENVDIKDFLFTNWDTTYGTLANGPGLKHFTDRAVVELLEIEFGDRAPFLGAYREIRKTAGLVPERPPKIKQVTMGLDGFVYVRPRRKK